MKGDDDGSLRIPVGKEPNSGDTGRPYRDLIHKESFGVQRAMGLSYLHELLRSSSS